MDAGSVGIALTIFRWGWSGNNRIGLSNQMPWASRECAVPAPRSLGMVAAMLLEEKRRYSGGTKEDRYHHASQGPQKWVSKIKAQKR